MTKWLPSRRWHCLATGLLLVSVLLPCAARSPAEKKQAAREQFEGAERLREELNAKPAGQRTRRDYQRVTDAYREVFFTAPTSSKADSAVVAMAELLAEAGRRFEDRKLLEEGIRQYQFLRREYPGSKYRVEALFAIGEIYQDDLGDAASAKATFEEYVRRYPRSPRAEDARAALEELPQPARGSPAREAPRPAAEPTDAASSPVPAKAVAPAAPHGHETLITGIRYWTTSDYTRVAIDLESEVEYQAGRVANPDRIFFDLQNAKLAPEFIGKNIDVQDGFLQRIRAGQYRKGMARVVLEVDNLADYSAFLLANPTRLVIDIHGRRNPPPGKPKDVYAGKDAGARGLDLMSAHSPSLSRPPAVPARSAAEAGGAAVASANPATGRQSAEAGATTKKTGDGTTSPLKYEDSARNSAPAPPAAARQSSQPSAAATPPSPSAGAAPAAVKLASLDPPDLKTSPPTTGPTYESVAPRAKLPKAKRGPGTNDGVHEATALPGGDRSLIRALGLKIGRIVVDAGHGGHDTGTIGPDGLQEKDLTLDVTLRLGKLLETKLGAEVIYTRKDDTFIPLETRTAVANQNQADLFISIHANSSRDVYARGVETYYLNFTSSPDALEVAARENAVSEQSIHELQDLVKKIALKDKIEESHEFAAEIQKSLWSGLAARSPAIKNRGVKKAPFVVLIGANMPSVLTEISFLSNPTDEHKLQTPEYRQKIAECLYRGITRYVSGLSGVKVAQKR
jgi:N-acetylmuramoyl-L-alanine amidase